MPAIICYVPLAGGGREIQMRVRLNSQRVAFPLEDMSSEHPRSLQLTCPGFSADLRLVGIAHGFAVYYIDAFSFDVLIGLIRKLCDYEPCHLPCVLTTPQSNPPT
jgi:hypothetical protein